MVFGLIARPERDEVTSGRAKLRVGVADPECHRRRELVDFLAIAGTARVDREGERQTTLPGDDVGRRRTNRDSRLLGKRASRELYVQAIEVERPAGRPDRGDDRAQREQTRVGDE